MMRRAMIGQMLWAITLATPAWAQSITSESLAPPAGVASKLPTSLSSVPSAPAVPKLPSAPSLPPVPKLPAAASLPQTPNAPSLPSSTTSALKNLEPKSPGLSPPTSAGDVLKSAQSPPAPLLSHEATGPAGTAHSLLGHSAPGHSTLGQGETPPMAAATPQPMRTAALSQPVAPRPFKPALRTASAKPLAKSALHAKPAAAHKAVHHPKSKTTPKPGAAATI